MCVCADIIFCLFVDSSGEDDSDDDDDTNRSQQETHDEVKYIRRMIEDD